MFGAVLEGGTLTSSVAGWCRLLVRPGVSRVEAFRVGNGVGAGLGVVGTLLGPEGAGNRCFVSGPSWFSYRRAPLGGGSWVWRGWWGGGWLDVENCTVDASIF